MAWLIQRMRIKSIGTWFQVLGALFNLVKRRFSLEVIPLLLVCSSTCRCIEMFVRTCTSAMTLLTQAISHAAGFWKDGILGRQSSGYSLNITLLVHIRREGTPGGRHLQYLL